MNRPRVKPSASPVKRSYQSPVRDEHALGTRRRIREAAESLFLSDGYAATSMSAIAAAASVSRPTVFNAFGSKLGVLKEVADVRLAGDDDEIDLLSRPTAKRILGATDPIELIRLHARYGAEIMERVAPIMAVVADAATTDPEAAELLATQEEGRLYGVGACVDRLSEIGALRPNLSRQRAKESLWLISGLEPWQLAMRRGWSRRRYEQWFFDCAQALLLRDDPG